MEKLRQLFQIVKFNVFWFISHPLSAVIVGVALVAGSVAGIPVNNEMYTYMWRDPDFCVNCHVHDYANEAWEHSVHARLTTCHDCHRVAIHHYPMNLFMAVFDRPQTPEDVPKADVELVVCEQCHTGGEKEPLTGPLTDELRAQVVRVDDSPLHQLHLKSKTRNPPVYFGGKGDEVEGEIVCMDCHGGEDREVHRFTSVAEECEACHEKLRPADEKGRSLFCVDCHARGFLGRSGHADGVPASE